MEYEIEITGLHKSFGARKVLNGIDLKIAKGHLTALIGPSGCGKSTLLRCLNGLEMLDEGRIRVNGFTLERRHAIPNKDKTFHSLAQKLRQHVGMVFQSYNLFPHLTLLQNVMLAPAIIHGIKPRDGESLALNLLEKVGLTGHASHYPRELSGGQQQRGAIARALAMKPKIMLYDEPTSALDPGLTDEIWKIMKALDQDGLTQVVVTHEYRPVKELADRVIFLDRGRIIEEASPDKIFNNPSETRTREFLRNELQLNCVFETHP